MKTAILIAAASMSPAETILVVGDTQVLCETYPDRNIELGTNIAGMIVADDVALTVHVGDWMNKPFSPMPPLAWDNGKASGPGGEMTTHGLTARAFADEFRDRGPWTLALGNHDFDNDGYPAPFYLPNLSTRGVSVVSRPEHLPMSLVSSEPWFVESMPDDGDDAEYAHAITFDLHGEPQLCIVLPTSPHLGMLDWALDVAARYADRRVWLVTHAWLDGGDAFDADGDMPGLHLSPDMPQRQSGYFRNQTQDGGGHTGYMGARWPMNTDRVWAEHLRFMPNLAFVFCGHTINGPAAHRSDVGAYGNTVHQLLVNAQSSRDENGVKTGGDGYMQRLEVHADGTINVTTIRALTGVVEDSPDESFSLELPAVHPLGDLDGNGSIGLADLLGLLSSWGECEVCPADLNRDGVVGFEDLLTMLSAWQTA